MVMDLRSLRYCEAIARLGSFTKASSELRIAQPALSVAIKKLEEELGVTLFLRQARQVIATPEADLLLRRANRIFEEISLAREEIRSAADLKIGEVKIGMPPIFGQHYFPSLLAGFRESYPSVAMTTMVGSADGIRTLLDAGAIDIAMLEKRRVPEGWASIEVGRDETVLCVPKSHPLSRHKVVDVSDLRSVPIVAFDSSFIQRNVLDEACREAGIKLQIALQSNYVPLIIEAVASGIGPAAMLRTTVADDPRITCIAFKPSLDFTFCLCWRERGLSNACRTFLDFAKTHGKPSRRQHP